jgi:multiple sugar transport system substrate-binding protein
MNPRWNKILLLNLVLILALALGACQPASTPAPVADTPAPASPTEPPAASQPVKLTFWNNWDNVNMEVMNKLVDQFNQAHPDIQVENVFQPYGDMMTLLQTSIAAKTTPDVAAVDLIFLPQLVATGGVQALDEYVSGDANIDVNDIYPMLAAYDMIGGQRYALPVSTNNMQLIWNKDLFTKAGLDPETPPKTWDEMKSMAEQCQDPANGVVGFEYYTQPVGEGITWQFQVWLWAAGGEFLNADNSAAAFNTPAGLKALSYVSDMLQGNGSTPGPWGLFGEQKACMQLDGSWLFGYRKDAPFQWGIAQVPAPQGGTTASNVGGEHILMFNDSPNKAQAWEFISYLTSPEVQMQWDQETGFLPVRKSVAENATYLDWVNSTEPRLMPFVEGMAYAHTRPATPKYNEISEAFSTEIQKALLGDTTPELALQSAEQSVNNILNQP